MTSSMEIGKRYIVVRGSEDGTFRKGDHLFFNEDGSVSCSEAQGWIPAEELTEASKGMIVEKDTQWLKLRKQKLLQELKALDAY